MALDPAISREHLKQELALVRELAATNKWGLIPDFDWLRLTVTLYAHNGDPFIVEIQCDNYKEIPPLFEFIAPDTGERGTRHAYPKTTDSFFHESGPCICAPFNRKAYKTVVPTGPHGDDWKLADWQTSTANSVNWANYSKLGDMIGLIANRLAQPAYYRGRMQ